MPSKPTPRLSFEIEVFGHPQPQGSTRAFIPKGWTRPIITSDNPALKSWRQEVTTAALEARPKGFPLPSGCPVNLAVVFYFAPPKSKKGKSAWKSTRPDVDKLLRAVQDALSGVAYADDSQIACAYVQKVFGSPERVRIEVSEITT
jgi:crossover junction endodeoxyribonuclease RusA